MFLINLGEWWIRDVKHQLPNDDLILIQITSTQDPFQISPVEDKFFKVFKFRFDDIDLKDFELIQETIKENGLNNSFKDKDRNDYLKLIKLISDEQAKEIASILIWAKNNSKNVIVNCQAGISRSGAIAEIGHELLGFDDPKNLSCLRHANKYVKEKVGFYINLLNCEKNACSTI